jgi:hypothetical protein
LLASGGKEIGQNSRSRRVRFSDDRRQYRLFLRLHGLNAATEPTEDLFSVA